MYAGEPFTGIPGTNVPVTETVEAFEKLVDGELDDTPEQAFVAVGGLEDVMAKARTMED